MAGSLTLSGRLTVADASGQLVALKSAIDALPAGAPAVVDAAGVTQVDTSALAVLLALKRHSAAAGRSFQAVALPPRLAGLATLYGVAELVS